MVNSSMPPLMGGQNFGGMNSFAPANFNFGSIASPIYSAWGNNGLQPQAQMGATQTLDPGYSAANFPRTPTLSDILAGLGTGRVTPDMLSSAGLGSNFLTNILNAGRQQNPFAGSLDISSILGGSGGMGGSGLLNGLLGASSNQGVTSNLGINSGLAIFGSAAQQYPPGSIYANMFNQQAQTYGMLGQLADVSGIMQMASMRSALKQATGSNGLSASSATGGTTGNLNPLAGMGLGQLSDVSGILASAAARKQAQAQQASGGNILTQLLGALMGGLGGSNSSTSSGSGTQMLDLLKSMISQLGSTNG